MSPSDAGPRPGQVTVAGWVVAIASAFLLLGVFDSLGSLNSLDVREAVARSIRSGNLQGLGLSVEDVLDLKRWAFSISAVAAVATGILGVFALRKDKAARIGLSVAAVPIVLAVPFTESFLGMLIGAGAAVLWTAPARDWFAGRPPAPREAPRPERRQPPVAPPPVAPPTDAPAPWAPPTAGPTGGPDSPQARAVPGWGAAPGPPLRLDQLPPPVASNQLPSPGPVAPRTVDRPRPVHLACMITWIATGLTAFGYLVLLVFLAVDQQAVIDLVKDNPNWDPAFDDDLIVRAAVISGVVILVWCAVAAVVAVFTWRGEHWAWVVHLVSLTMAAMISLAVFPNSFFHLAAVAATFGLLTRRQSRDWFAGRR
ncbi:hypothetical protein [Marmoricola sp. OAE513]|uniref:hypothetical protein n=1 Tax=Marmoricola sp. OAE513 TaxID=2817894 RepID=UPI001AEB7680